MHGFYNIWRLIRTGATFERTGAIHVVLNMLEMPTSVRITARILGWPFTILGLRGDTKHPPVLRALIALGPVYIKFGQLLSTRPDVVGVAMATELKILQDRITPFPQKQAIKEIEKELNAPLNSLFSEFGPAVAAASIAQVHQAVLRSNGQKVAVKILRPAIERAFRKDINAFYFAAQLIEFVLPSSRRLRPKAVIKHFDTIVQSELDLRIEAAAASEFAANTQNDKGFKVPQLIWHYSARRVMTLEWQDGITLSDIDSLRASGCDLAALSQRLIQMFLRHALRDGFFHADMHQGNLKLALDDTLVALDFGIMGRLNDYTRQVYAEILMGFIRKDYKRVAAVHFEADYVATSEDIDAFAQALRAIGEPIFGQSVEQISMARLMGHLFEVTERFGMRTRTELILLQRTMVVVEGVARSLNPNLNIWDVARPELEAYIASHFGAKALARDMHKTLKVVSRFGSRLPQILDSALNAASKLPPTSQSMPLSKKILWMLLGAVLGNIILLLFNMF